MRKVAGPESAPATVTPPGSGDPLTIDTTGVTIDQTDITIDQTVYPEEP